MVANAAGKESGKPSGKVAGKHGLPWWLLGLLVAVLGLAFSHRDVGGHAADALVADLSFDLGSLDAPGAGPAALPYSASRRSNRAFALVHLGEGRFYALYGPPPAPTEPAPALAGVLVGEGHEADGVFSSDSLHEFSIESGPLRIASQEGRYAPARFVEGDTVHADADDRTLAVPPAGLAGQYRGRLADLAGTADATLTVADDGRFTLRGALRCTAEGQARPLAARGVWEVEARFGAGCAHDGETLRGHAVLRQGALYLVLPSEGLDGGALFSAHATAAARQVAQLR